MTRPAPIRLDADRWAIMRNATDHPAAIVNRVTDLQGSARFLVLVWHLDPAQRRMFGIYSTLEAADAVMLYDNADVATANRGKPRGRPNGGRTLHGEMPTSPSRTNTIIQNQNFAV